MSFFSRVNKTQSAVRKGEPFQSADDGSKDAGASKRMMGDRPLDPSEHMRMIADQHDTEAGMHDSISDKSKMIGLDKRAAEHKEVANEHALAAGHYRAAAQSIEGARDRVDPMDDQKNYLDAGKDHLAAARKCAGKACDCTNSMK
jgi:hypothetical protein